MQAFFAKTAPIVAFVGALLGGGCAAAGDSAAPARGQAPSATQAQSPARGQLLYETHCIECHTTQMHWRSQKLARDWATLRAQVTRWQGVAKLNWSEQEIDDVTHYLNDTIYQFPPPQGKVVGR